jgi:hypothetical protein
MPIVNHQAVEGGWCYELHEHAWEPMYEEDQMVALMCGECSDAWHLEIPSAPPKYKPMVRKHE